jgi:hypothetical protein
VNCYLKNIARNISTQLLFLILLTSCMSLNAQEPPFIPDGIWISRNEISIIPMEGAAWDDLLSQANSQVGTPNLSDQDSPVNVRVMAKALVYARTGDESYRSDVIDSVMAAIGTEAGGRTLALGRELAAYVIAADLVGLPSAEDQQFRTWLSSVRTRQLDGRNGITTLLASALSDPSNWGCHARASAVAAALYLGDRSQIAELAEAFHDYTGRDGSRFGFKELDWQADPDLPVGINPPGATKLGHSIDGVIPDDQRRAGAFAWPPPKESYVWESLQGTVAAAVMLQRAGYQPFGWEDQAILRAVKWLHEQADYPATGDDEFIPWLVNYYYGSDFPATDTAKPGKNVGWSAWTHEQSLPRPRPPELLQ